MLTKTAAELRIPALYHYQAFDKPKRFAQIFADRTLYFSNPRHFNDPWDCKPFFNRSALGDDSERDKTVRWFVDNGRRRGPGLPEQEHQRREAEWRSNRPLLESMIDEFSREMDEEIQRQYRVFCLSRHPDSTLMWAHYAASCRGMCLEFSVQNALICGALEVNYFDEYPLFSTHASDDDSNLQPLLSKSAVWKYEDEFRVFATNHPYIVDSIPTARAGFVELPAEAMTVVILGPLMSQSDRVLVQQIIADSGWSVRLKEARVVRDQYAFEITDLQ